MLGVSDTLVYSGTGPEEMALSLNADDKKWIKEQIKTSTEGVNSQLAALKTSVDALAKPPARSGRRVALFLKEWGATSGAMGAFVALMIFALTSVNTNSEFRGKTNQRLDRIEEDLRELRASSQPHKVLGELAALPATQFKQSLAALKAVSQQPTTEVKPTRTELASISKKLIETSANAPDYWPTTLSFIGFASAAVSSASIPPPSLDGIHLKNVFGAIGGLDHQTVILDGGTISGLTIRGSRIVFTDVPVKLVNVRFIDCAFEFRTGTQQPSYYITEVAKEILQSPLNSVFMTSFG
jgi:hypothetical protein